MDEEEDVKLTSKARLRAAEGEANWIDMDADVPKDAPNEARIDAVASKAKLLLEGLAAAETATGADDRDAFTAGGVVGGEGCTAGACRGDSEARLQLSSSSSPLRSSVTSESSLLLIAIAADGDGAATSCVPPTPLKVISKDRTSRRSA